jgi:predicted nucleotidyltransferase
MKAREGDLLKDLNEIIFDVKGLVHPKCQIIAFPRFIPDSQGTRIYEGIAYDKVYSISARFEFLEKNFPNYIVYDPVFDEKLCEVSSENVKHHYKPANCLKELRQSKKLDMLEEKALRLLETLRYFANVPWEKMGISGSLLVKLHTASSDIDPIVYGSKNCQKVYLTLQSILKNGDVAFKPYTVEDLKVLFYFRSKDTLMGFEDFVAIESRKVLQGKFMGKDYFIRFVKEWDEISEKYGDIRYKNCGYAKIKATIKDDSESIFTPCIYIVENVRVIEGSKLQPIQEIASFRGRFCEQARTGEVVVAQGKVEHVMDYSQNREHFRLLLGNKPSDYMILA